MADWWRNHKQTYRQDTDDGYIESLQTNANGARNVSDDNHRGLISQIGMVTRAEVMASKSAEFGSTDDNCSQDAWLVRVNWHGQRQPGGYLAGLSETLGWLLLELIEDHADQPMRVHVVVLAEEGKVSACRVMGQKRREFLVASPIKPWRDCDNRERLDGANGLLLSPHVDKLFDHQWISSMPATLC